MHKNKQNLVGQVGHKQLVCVMTGLAVLGMLAGSARAQSDNFNDGNDSANPTWQRYNPIGVGTWSFPDGNSYRIQANPSPNPQAYGQGRAGSLLAVNYTNFYVSVDIVAQDYSLHQVAGVLARVSSVGPGTTKGYLFSYDSSSPFAGLRGDLDIVILNNEVGKTIPNVSGNDRFSFEQGKQYRMVFIGIGPELNGLVYELPNTTVPVVHLRAIDTNYLSGWSGLVIANNEEPTYGGGADATFDNFYAGPADNFWQDNFNDGNDSAPLPGWARYNPIGTGSHEFANGNSYRIRTAASPDPGTYGQGRAGSFKPINLDKFFVSVDVVGWDDSIHQIGGLAARISNVGPGTTSGYILTHDRGNPASSTSGDMDIVRLDFEYPTVLPNLTGSDGIHFDPAKKYRIVFIGDGPDLTAKVYELPNLLEPVVHLTTQDGSYTSGAVGLIVANNAASYDGPGDMTFDNFVALPREPVLSWSLAEGNLNLTWPYIAMNLETANSPEPSSWSKVTSGIVAGDGKFSYSTPLSEAPKYFRLAP